MLFVPTYCKSGKYVAGSNSWSDCTCWAVIYWTWALFTAFRINKFAKISAFSNLVYFKQTGGLHHHNNLLDRQNNFIQSIYNTNLRAISISRRYRCCCVRDVGWTGTVVDGVHQQTQAVADPIGDRTSECYYDSSMVTLVNTSNVDNPGAPRNP